MSFFDAKPSVSCVICGSVPEGNEALRICQMCHRKFCASCEIKDFGREFCSSRCRDLFFYGDDVDGIEE